MIAGISGNKEGYQGIWTSEPPTSSFSTAGKILRILVDNEAKSLSFLPPIRYIFAFFALISSKTQRKAKILKNLPIFNKNIAKAEI